MPLPKAYFEEGPEIVFASINDISLNTEGEWGPSIVVTAVPIGETVERLLFFKAESASGRRSAWQRFLRNFRNTGMEVTSGDDLIGDQVYRFQIVTESYEFSGEVREKDIWVCKEVYQNEEAALEDFLAHQANIGLGVEDEPVEAEPAEVSESGFSADFLKQAKQMYEASGGDDNFLQIAELSYEEVTSEETAKALLAAIKA
jgi:hypothetical protein